MPTSDPGSSGCAVPRHRARGFTLIELLVVVAIIAVSAAVITLALRDGSADRLAREGERLATLLEAARAESRIAGVAVWWRPADDAGTPGFRFVGLAAGAPDLPTQWLDPEVRAVVIGAPQVQLGPEPLIGAQRIELQLQRQRLIVGTDGLSPFAVQTAGQADEAAT
ncbi:MAG: prepilin-type N-terminal cleavage/methylation domain-containing protein [Rubrivivax sp.]|nr:prepilin-type N-terminal cleavage/methylation domain-containing protein [Rubrivivax sp.]